jgi:Mn-dependent DtxR family transcriptional regulator
VLVRRGLVERDEQNGYRLTEAGRTFARSLKGELTS